MNEKNLSYLQDKLKYLGFGEHLHEALAAAVGEGKKDFTLTLQTELDRQPFSATLHFRKSDTTEVYFLNKWDAELKSEEGKRQQTFYLDKGHGITLKEGFNLLQGRAVHKELTGKDGHRYAAWLQLDTGVVNKSGNSKLRSFHEDYGYNLESALSRLPLRELTDGVQKERLLYALQKGNRTAVTFEQNGFAEKLFIEAAPQFKSLNVYDHSGAPIPPGELEKRFEPTLKKEGPELSPLGRAGGTEAAQGSAKDYGLQGAARQQAGPEHRELRPDTGAPKGSLLPRREAPEGGLPKKRTARGKGLHP